MSDAASPNWQHAPSMQSRSGSCKGYHENTAMYLYWWGSPKPKHIQLRCLFGQKVCDGAYHGSVTGHETATSTQNTLLATGFLTTQKKHDHFLKGCSSGYYSILPTSQHRTDITRKNVLVWIQFISKFSQCLAIWTCRWFLLPHEVYNMNSNISYFQSKRWRVKISLKKTK